jgi:hypothetical protein
LSSGASSSSNTPLIVSSVLGAVFFVFFLGLLFYFIRCRRVLRRKKTQAYTAQKDQWITPFFSRSIHQAKASTPSDSKRSFPPDVEKLQPAPPLPEFPAGIRPHIDPRPISNGYPFKNRRFTATTFASIGTEVSSIRFNPLTGRQIELEARINKLNAMLLPLEGSIREGTGSPDQASKLRGLIEQLTKLKESPYALGQTDVVPPGWH